MKISEMSNDQASEAMIRLTGAFAALCEDDEMMTLLDNLNGKTWRDALKNALPRLVSFALSKHKNELYEIVGALNSIPTANVGKMNFVQTVKSVRDSYDEVLAAFFTSSAMETNESAAASA